MLIIICFFQIVNKAVFYFFMFKSNACFLSHWYHSGLRCYVHYRNSHSFSSIRMKQVNKPWEQKRVKKKTKTHKTGRKDISITQKVSKKKKFKQKQNKWETHQSKQASHRLDSSPPWWYTIIYYSAWECTLQHVRWETRSYARVWSENWQGNR